MSFNDVTKKATATIELKHVVGVHDDNDPEASSSSVRKRASDSYDAIFKVERSFRLLFRDEEEIEFFADTDEDKTKWLVRVLYCYSCDPFLNNAAFVGCISSARLLGGSRPIPCGPNSFGRDSRIWLLPTQFLLRGFLTHDKFHGPHSYTFYPSSFHHLVIGLSLAFFSFVDIF